MSARVYLGLGSNLGDREAYLRRACALLAARPGITIRRLSPIYETAPVGPVPQGPFLNAVLEADTDLPPRELLRAANEVEASLGRVRETRWGPRTVDVDILLYGDLVLEEPDLRIPHPRLAERAFVLVPLADLAPDLVVPGQGPVARLREECKDCVSGVLPWRGERC